MRVLLVHASELGGLGGVEVAVQCLVQEFPARGCPTGVIEMAPRRKPRRLLPDGVPAWSVACSSFPMVRRLRSWASFARATWQFLGVVREFRPDIVNVHFPEAQALPIVAAHALPHRWRLVVTVHGSDIRVDPLEDPRLRLWQARLLARADAVTAVSQSLLEDTVQLHPHVRGKGLVIRNGVGPMWFQDGTARREAAERYVLFAGRLSNVKGVDILLRAWNRVSPHQPGIRLWIAGSGPESERLQALARDLGVLDTVRFLGWQPQDGLARLYRDADAVALPSRSEGMPFAVLEAQAAGALTIATMIPGTSELIEPGITGYLVKPESPEALAATILTALQLPADTSRRLREAAQNAVRARFSTDRMVSAYLGLFESLCSAHSAQVMALRQQSPVA